MNHNWRIVRPPLCVIVSIVALLAVLYWFSIPKTDSPLFNAAGVGDLDKVQSLIKTGVAVDERSAQWGWTPLICAVFHNQPHVVAYLLEAGADPNVASVDGKTPLMYATSHGDSGIGIVKDLIAHGADLYVKDKTGETVFDYAKSDPPEPQIIKLLEQAKLDQEIKSQKK